MIESDFVKSFGDDLEKIKKDASKYHAYEQAVKLMLNSIYGAFGNPYFYFFNVDIAETITLQGKDAILYTEALVNKYFSEFWHKDIAAHTEMGITVTGRIEKPVGIYIDTDSIYMKFDEVIKKSDWSGNEKDFILNFTIYLFSLLTSRKSFKMDFNICDCFRVYLRHQSDGQYRLNNYINFSTFTTTK